MQRKSSKNTGPTSSDTATCAKSEPTTLNPLTSSAEGSRAKTYHAPETKPESKRARAVGSGSNMPESFASLDPNGSWLKTYQGSCQQMLDGTWEEFLETWPRAGLMSNGNAYQLPPLVPRICEKESGYWPTPNTQGWRGDGELRLLAKKVTSYEEFCILSHRACMGKRRRWYPTPTIRGEYNKRGASKTAGDGLATVLGGRPNPPWKEWLMGFQMGWTEIGASATPSSPK